jgi:D-xylose 1-dehydrogenase (NADP+, D-xylono-1,5-lactone-forming)
MTQTRHLRWGLLCTARINRSVIPPIRLSKRSELVAVASRTRESASRYAATWEIPHFYSSYEDLLADPEIDVIYNSLPNALHAEWSIKAMQMGKHVLCEKPLTINVNEAEAVMTASKNTGRIITEAFMYRHHPQTLLVKQMIDDGKIGKIQLIRGSFCYSNTRPSDIRFDPALGGGSLWDIGCYPISYTRYLTGKEPTEVFGYQVTNPNGVDLSFAGQLLFPGRVISQFECSFVTPYKVEMEITGDKGRIKIPDPYKPGKRAKIYFQHKGQEQIINIKGPELYQGEIEDLEDAILLEKPARISLEESRGNISTIEALYQSAQRSIPVTSRIHESYK